MDLNELKIAGVVEESIVDGKGLRFTIFTQGCPHRCEGCHNPHTHDFSGGETVAIHSLLTKIVDNPLLRGVTFSGGEPFCQAKPLALLAKLVHARKLDVTVYTGYTLEELDAMHDEAVDELLAATDVLIDGKFILAERDLRLPFRGSRNQRMIDMQKTREAGKVILMKE